MAGETRAEATAKLYEQITATAVEPEAYAPEVRATVLRDLAIAYRAVAGGPQAGTSVVEK